MSDEIINLEAWEDPDDYEEPESEEDVAEAQRILIDRCNRANFTNHLLDDSMLGWSLSIEFPNGPQKRNVAILSLDAATNLIAIPFEKFSFIADLEAIVCYELGTIEAVLAPARGTYIGHWGIERLLGLKRPRHDDVDGDDDAHMIAVPPPTEGLPHIEIGPPSKELKALSARHQFVRRLSLRLSNCRVKRHDEAHILLSKIAGAVLFQINLATGVQFALERLSRDRRPIAKPTANKLDLKYPETQYESAPLELYSYGESAKGMPLLQFLAFYQVIEFFYPIYSESEAHRKLKAILKDPVFRGDRDADVSKLLHAIHISRSGSFGDERSQLKATLLECTDSASIREFLMGDPNRKAFFEAKAKTRYHKLNLSSPSHDIRDDVALRVYDIRCKIVHTKSDSRDGAVELLLPFSAEAEQLAYDIQLVRYLAQRVLIVSSEPLRIYG